MLHHPRNCPARVESELMTRPGAALSIVLRLSVCEEQPSIHTLLGQQIRLQGAVLLR